MDPLITWQQNRPSLSDSLPAAELQPAWLAFINTFLPWELAALSWGPLGPTVPPKGSAVWSLRCHLPWMLLWFLPFEDSK